jgi:hypothetical protein
MPRKVPKKINYMDMKIPFSSFRVPKAKEEQRKLIERFDAEFNGRYELNPWIDPSYDMNLDGSPVYVENSFEEKLRRLKRREYMILRLKRAERNNDQHEIDFCNSFRDLPPLPGSDNGWNVIPTSDKLNEEYRKKLDENE